MKTEKMVGFARLDITPQLGTPIPGYYETRLADDVLDPLFVNALAFREGEKAAVLLVCDLLGGYGEAGYRWPKIIGDAVGISDKAVFVCHTHTHTGGDINSPEEDPWLTRRLCDAAKLALKDCKPVKNILTANGEAPGMSFVRRFKRKDGTFQTWGSPTDTNLVDYASENDVSLRLIRIEREDAPEIVIGNFQVHPDNVGGCGISADYPGSFRNRIEAERPGCRCVFLDGAEGQQIRNDSLHGPVQPKSHAAAMAFGEKLAGFALDIYDKAQPLEDDSALNYDIQITRVRTKRDDSRVEECQRILKIHEEGRDEELHPRRGNQICIVSNATQILRLYKAKLDYVYLNVSVITFGGLAFVGFPGEPFNEMGKYMRANSPYPMTCVCCQTNGSEGYIATAEGYDQGGYEPGNSKMAKGVAEALLDTAVSMLKDMKKA